MVVLEKKVSTRDSVYTMKGKLVNIKYAHDDWHAIGKRALEIIGFFVFISKNAVYSISFHHQK